MQILMLCQKSTNVGTELFHLLEYQRVSRCLTECPNCRVQDISTAHSASLLPPVVYRLHRRVPAFFGNYFYALEDN
jgi:Fe-S oxidoreductase